MLSAAAPALAAPHADSPAAAATDSTAATFQRPRRDIVG
jgi:hypothetical protein